MSKAMNSLHRVVVVLTLMALLAAAVGVAGATLHDAFLGSGLAGAHPQHIFWSSHAVHASAAWLLSGLSAHLDAIAGVSTLATLALGFLLGLELRSVVQRRPRLVLSRGGLGEVAISFDQVSLLAQHEAEHIHGVREVQTSAASSKTGLAVQQTIAVEPDQQLPALAEEIQRKVKTSLEYHLGFPVGEVRIALQRASLTRAVV